MWVYGDLERSEPAGAVVERLRQGCAALPGPGPGPRPDIVRHGLLVTLLIEAGMLSQALADARMAEAGTDSPAPPGAPLPRLLAGLAAALACSLRSGLHAVLPVDAAPLAELAGASLPERVTLRTPEGYAFYALYPEAYLAAAEALRRHAAGPFHVIGIRSIGESLAPVVAAGLGAPGAEAPEAPVVSVRPVGPPFARALALGEELARRLRAAAPAASWALVDEGPGLSGSSFGAVADWLEDAGAPADRIHFFPSHGGDLGPAASERHRLRWRSARRHLVDPEALLLRDGARGGGLAGWAADLTGPAEGPLIDLAGGRWRALLLADRQAWPGVHLQQERRKYLLPAGGRRWLCKFAGLGRTGEERLRRARALAAAGLVPDVSGLRHGFLVGEWLDGWRPLPAAGPAQLPRHRPALLAHLQRHLAFVSTRFPAEDPAEGAAPDRLLAMARRNGELALGPDALAALRRFEPEVGDACARARPVRGDGRLHAWEWLVGPGGDVRKADALDHHQAHDLVGAQDPAWDVAGAAVELGLSADEEDALVAHLRRALPAWSAWPHLRLYRACYLAFQLGSYTLARAAADDDEAPRVEREIERYRAQLARLLFC